jgi:phage-related baseplate assembly protein
VRRLGVPERTVTALDFERRALASEGTSLWRTRALTGVDPRLPGLVADGCITVVVVPWLPVDRPEPTPELLARIRADLATARTVGTRVFVVGAGYVHIGVRATLRLLPGARSDGVIAAGNDAVQRFLHPVTGGPSGRGWPFGRPVRRSEILQLLDELSDVDRVEGLVLVREKDDGSTQECGDLTICPTDLVLAGSIDLATAYDQGGR